MTSFHQVHTRFIPARHQAALALEYARSREVDSDVLLRGTSVFAGDFLVDGVCLNPQEYLRMLRNLEQALGAEDTSFLLGQQLLPGHYGHPSHALQQATSLRQALDILVSHQARFSPLLAPHCMDLGGRLALYWTECCGKPGQRAFLVEMMMTAVAAMSRWLSGQRLPWQFCFNRTKPRHIEQYEVHLGPQLRFGDYLDAMIIDEVWLDSPWPRGSDMAVTMALAQEAVEAAPGPALLSALHRYLMERIRLTPSLEQSAADFAVSPATFKRYLAQHGTSFQAELDQVRALVTLHLIHARNLNNDEIAAYLGFHDANNFRRSLKRWTGLTPSMLRQHQLGEVPSRA